MTVSTLDPGAGVILTTVVKALALVLADVGSGTETFVLATLAFDAAFAIGTTIGGTGALHTTAFFASFAIRAGGTGLDTLAVRGIAELVFSTVTVDTEVGDTLAVVAEFSVFAASGVASGRDTLAVDADGRAGTIAVVFTNAITATLTIATSLAVGTFDTSAGVCDTTIHLTDTTGFAGRAGAFVIATGAIEALLAEGTLHIGAGVSHTLAVDALLIVFAVDTGTTAVTLTCATELAFVTLLVFAEVGFAFSVDTGFVGLTIAIFFTKRFFAFTTLAETIGRTIAVYVTGRRRYTLTVFADFFAARTFDTSTGIVTTTVAEGITDTFVLAGSAGVAIVVFALTGDTELAGGAGDSRAGVCDTNAIHAKFSFGATAAGTGLCTLSIGAAAEFVCSTFATTVFVEAGVCSTGTGNTEFVFGAGGAFVTAGKRTATFETDIIGGTITVNCTRQAIDTLTCHTTLSFAGTLHALAGIIDTVAVLITDATIFAGAAVTGVFDTGGVGGIGAGVADLTFLAGSGGAGIGFALPVFADLTL